MIDTDSNQLPITPNELSIPRKVSSATWIGLFISLFGMLIIRQAIWYFWPTLTFTAAIWKESLIWLSAAVCSFLSVAVKGYHFGRSGLGHRAGGGRFFGVFSSLCCVG